MAKTDIDKAFRILQIYPSDYELLCMKIENQFYYDKALPVGCSISQCRHALESFEKLCFDINIPIKPSNTIHPTTALTFL